MVRVVSNGPPVPQMKNFLDKFRIISSAYIYKIVMMILFKEFSL